MTDMQAGDFFRVHDGPRAWAFGRCREHDAEWLVVEFYYKWPSIHWELGVLPRLNWTPRTRSVSYPYALAAVNIARFLSYAEVWP